MEVAYWLLGAFLLLFIVLFCVVALIEHIKREQWRREDANRNPRARLSRMVAHPSAKRSERVNPPPKAQRQGLDPKLQRQIEADEAKARKLKQRLVLLLRGDKGAAERLIEMARFKKPFMPESWYLEKVIADLERDRFR